MILRLFVALGCCCPLSVMAESGFEEAFLMRDKNGVSKDVFIYQNAMTPGMKNADVRINDQLAEHMEVLFVVDSANQVIPCLSRTQLKNLGIKVELYDGWVTTETRPESHEADASVCEDIAKRIPAAQLSYDQSRQELKLIVPQEAVDRQRFTMISPLEWDHGVASLRTGYRGYFYESHIKGRSGDKKYDSDSVHRSAYVNLNSVGTLGQWRFYSIDSFYRDQGKGWQTNHDRSYLARDIAALRSSLQAGEIYTKTSGSMTGTVPMSGVMLATSERMSLDNQFQYAPVVRGVARTNARLVVRQRGNIIYSTTLTPGPFAIDDLYSAQVGADLEVTVEESDGQHQVFRVPYTALPNMIRPGAFRYSTAAGKYRSQSSGTDEPWLVNSSLEYGFEHFTLSGTALASKNYQSISAGAAWNVGNWGAFSAEVAHARYKETWSDDHTRDGSAIRFLYARYFDSTDTSLQILGYQYRSKEFMDFQEYISRQSYNAIDGYQWWESEWDQRKRSRVEMNLSQNLSGYGSLYASVSQDRYYGTSRKSTSISAGAGTTIGKANVSLSLTRIKDGHTNDTQLGLSINLPLGSADRGKQNGYLNYNLTRDRDNHYNQSLGYSNTAFDNLLSYSVNAQRNKEGEYSQSGSLGYNGSLTNINGSISRSRYSEQYSAGINGGVTLYSGGVVLSPTLGNTVAIVKTPGVSGIGVSGSGRTKTDYFGNAMVTSLTPYRYNHVSLDVSKTEGVELKESARKFVPSEGAAVLLEFATRVGRRAMVQISSVKAIPLGAMVYVDGEKEEAGIVGGKGEAYLSGLDAGKDQKLNVIWGDSPAQQCSFVLAAATDAQRQPENWYLKVPVQCQ